MAAPRDGSRTPPLHDGVALDVAPTHSVLDMAMDPAADIAASNGGLVGNGAALSSSAGGAGAGAGVVTTPPVGAEAEAEAAAAAASDKPLRVFIQRSYAKGTIPQFETDFPPELDGKVDAAVLKQTVDGINRIFVEAETLSAKLCLRNFMSCLMGYALDVCLPNPYDKYLDQLSDYVEDQDRKVYAPLKLRLIDPLDRGLRVLEIQVLPST